MKLVVDAMGGDLGCDIPIRASIQALIDFPEISHLILVGDKTQLFAGLQAQSNYQTVESKVAVQHSQGVISMRDKPAAVLKQRDDSSMLQALRILVDGGADACVSAGNTGALVGLSRHFCGLHSNLKRLAICAQLPTHKRSSFLLDVGGNVDCSADLLYQFACMGSALVESIGVARPCRVSALSIGTEAGKGNAAVRQAAELCSKNELMNFSGMIEGDSLLLGESDVIFCDGFVGNIALKSSEGTARYIRSLAKKLVSASEGSTASLPETETYRQFVQAINPDQFNGAYLLGLNHLVVKAHGSSNAEGFGAAIGKAVRASAGQLQTKLAALL